MNEIERVLAKLQDVAPVVVEATRRQIWIDLWVWLVLLALTVPLSVWLFRKEQRRESYSDLPAYGIAGTMVLVLAILALFGVLIGVVEVLNPDYAVYRRLVR